VTELTPPVACTLDPAQMPQRTDEIRALGRDGLEAVERGERHVTLRFRSGSEIRARVERIVAAESRCCAFLDFEIVREGDATAVTIVAPEGGQPAMHQLADVFAAGAG
jgi:hypothetical protein